MVASNGFVMPCEVGDTRVPVASGTSTDTRAPKWRDMKPSVAWITSPVLCNSARSRANSYSVRARFSRWEATRTWKRMVPASWPMVTPTASITANVR